MQQYTATFHTHLSAMMSERSLKKSGFSARMAPVPRSLSSSCGTCVFYEADGPHEELLDEDWESVYLQTGARYDKLLQNSD